MSEMMNAVGGLLVVVLATALQVYLWALLFYAVTTRLSIPQRSKEMKAHASNSFSTHLRMMTVADIPRVMEIECDSFNEPWSAKDFKALVRCKHHLCSVAVINERVVGYLIYEIKTSATYLKSMAVSPNYRRQGIATKLIYQMLDLMERTNRYSTRMHVAENNLLAQKFLRAIGFKATAVCREFYGELDAYYFIKRLPKPAGAVSGTKANG